MNTPNISELYFKLSQSIDGPDQSSFIQHHSTKTFDKWSQIFEDMKNFKLDDDTPIQETVQKIPSQKYLKEKESLSKLLIELAESKNQKIQQKLRNLCQSFEEIVDLFPKMQSTLTSMNSLQARLEDSTAQWNEALAEAKQLHQAEVAKIKCIEKRIKRSGLEGNDASPPEGDKSQVSLTRSSMGLLIENPEGFETSFHSALEDQPTKGKDVAIVSAFGQVFKEVKCQKCEGFIIKKEQLVSSSKLDMDYVTIRYNTAEKQGFLVKGSGQLLFILPSNDIWQLFKAMVKGEGMKCLENFFVPLLTQNQVYKVEMKDAKTSKGHFTPLQKV